MFKKLIKDICNKLIENMSTDGMFTCCSAVKIQFLREVQEIWKLSVHNLHDITKECSFSVRCPGVLQLKVKTCSF